MPIFVTTCPKCGAITKRGHDEDGQMFCAFCKTSFVPAFFNRMTNEEYEILKTKSEFRSISGWEAMKRFEE